MKWKKLLLISLLFPIIGVPGDGGTNDDPPPDDDKKKDDDKNKDDKKSNDNQLLSVMQGISNKLDKVLSNNNTDNKDTQDIIPKIPKNQDPPPDDDGGEPPKEPEKNDKWTLSKIIKRIIVG